MGLPPIDFGVPNQEQTMEKVFFDWHKAVTASFKRPPILMFMGQYDPAGSLSSISPFLAHNEKVGVVYKFAWAPGFDHFYPAGAVSLGEKAESNFVEGSIVDLLERVIGRGLK